MTFRILISVWIILSLSLSLTAQNHESEFDHPEVFDPLVSFSVFAVYGSEFDHSEVFDPEYLMPEGEYYQSMVPDTLDLSERAKLSVKGLTEFLSPGDNYCPYKHAHFNTNPAFMYGPRSGSRNWGKIAEGLIMTRLMSGSEENLEIQSNMLEGLIDFAAEWDGSYTVDRARAMLAIMALEQQHHSPHQIELIQGMADSLEQIAQYENDLAWYSDPPRNNLGYTWQPFINGTVMRALTRWSVYNNDPSSLQLAGKLNNFMLQDRFWIPEKSPKAVAPMERAHFMGHFHGHTQYLMGLLWYAEVTGDQRMMEFVRSGYEYVRNFGLAKIGLFGEMCATGDMTFLALKLSDLGVGDYWEDADGYIRNHLTEPQIRDIAKMHQVVETMPDLQPDNEPFPEVTENVIERNIGTFFSDSTHPSLIPEKALIRAICCTGNCTVALYFAWESIVHFEDGTATINLLLNRASPWLDVKSYLPYEGKVVIENKKAKEIYIRIPNWADPKTVKCISEETPLECFFISNFLAVPEVKPGATITITFPMVERELKYTLKWKRISAWREFSNPGGGQWEPLENPDEYTCLFRGNTLVDISPRTEAKGYPLYQRDHYRQNKAPMKEVERFVSETIFDW